MFTPRYRAGWEHINIYWADEDDHRRSSSRGINIVKGPDGQHCPVVDNTLCALARMIHDLHGSQPRARSIKGLSPPVKRHN